MLAIILTILAAVGVGVAIERRSNPLAHRVRFVALQSMLWVLVPFVAYVNIARLHLSVDAGLSIVIAGLTHVPHVYLYSAAALRGLSTDLEEAALQKARRERRRHGAASLFDDRSTTGCQLHRRSHRAGSICGSRLIQAIGSPTRRAVPELISRL